MINLASILEWKDLTEDEKKVVKKHIEECPEASFATMVEARRDEEGKLCIRYESINREIIYDVTDFSWHERGATKPVIYGYARVSTKYQESEGNSLESQEKQLLEAGASQIIREASSGTTINRPLFTQLIDSFKTGDTLMVTKLDRLARSTTEGVSLIERLLNDGIRVHVLNMGLMDQTPTGKLIRTILMAFAEFERDQIVERTKEGRAIARQKPGYKDGRKKKYSKAQMQHALKLLETNSYKQVESLTGISKSTLIRAKKELE